MDAVAAHCVRVCVVVVLMVVVVVVVAVADVVLFWLVG